MPQKYNSGSVINHLGLVRLRIQGEGELEIRVMSLNSASGQQLVDLTLEEGPEFIPTVLANYSRQMMCLDIRVTEIDEWFTVTSITPFISVTAKSLPQ